MEAIALEVGLPVESLVKLDANENVYGADPRVMTAMADSLQPKAHVYPDPLQQSTRQAILDWLHSTFPEVRETLSIDNIVAGAGSDDVLDMSIRLLSPKAIVISSPTFGMYKFLGELVGARVIDVPRRGPDFDVDIDAVIDAVRENGATMVFLPSPNNPTGNCLSLSEIRRLCESCAALIVLDEAYAEFAFDVHVEAQQLLAQQGITASQPFVSSITLLTQLSNLVVTRTFSKWAGLAGLRVGFLVGGCRELIAGLLAIKQPYNISVTAEAGACAALRARPTIMHSIAALYGERDRLFELLQSFSAWLRPLPSQANFILCEVTEAGTALTGITALQAYQYARRNGVLIRYFGTQGGALTNYFRISAGKPEHTDRLIAALRSLEIQQVRQSLLPATAELWRLQKEAALSWWRIDALLFDMDGVIVDVGDSYRRAIIDTAAYFHPQRAVTAEDIEEVKAAGNANNDWAVTLELLRRFKQLDDASSAPPTFEQVREKFEELYQGGLYKNESLLIEPAIFEGLQAVLPLAIVTGRPRQPDAVRFLSDYAIGKFFEDRLVCMEDAPLKPSPAPVLLALKSVAAATGRQNLRAAMIGDTVDDIVAAKKAGVLPLGVLPPRAKNPDQSVETLYQAGAFHVFQSTFELQASLRQLLQ